MFLIWFLHGPFTPKEVDMQSVHYCEFCCCLPFENWKLLFKYCEIVNRQIVYQVCHSFLQLRSDVRSTQKSMYHNQQNKCVVLKLFCSCPKFQIQWYKFFFYMLLLDVTYFFIVSDIAFSWAIYIWSRW